MKRRIENWIFRYLSGNPDEYCTPPGSECWFEFGEMDDGKPMYTATTYNNDGFEIWLCHTQGGGRWWGFYPAPAARRLAWHILWDWWAVATWFGLKRKLWYWALHRQVERQTKL